MSRVEALLTVLVVLQFVYILHLHGVIKGLLIDTLTGFFVASRLHRHLAWNIEDLLRCEAAQKIMNGAKWHELTASERNSIEFSIFFIDLSYLALFNQAGDDKGDLALRRLSECVRRRMKDRGTIWIRHGMRLTRLARQLGVRKGGDEFVICFRGSPQEAQKLIDDAIEEFSGLTKGFEKVPLPPGADFGGCTFYEALKCVNVWGQKRPMPEGRKGLTTLIKQLMMGIAAKRCKTEKNRSRIALLAEKYHNDRPLFDRISAFALKGSDAISAAVLERLISAVEATIAAAQKCDGSDELLLSEFAENDELTNILDEMFESDLLKTRYIISQVGKIDGYDHYMRELIDLASIGKERRFREDVDVNGQAAN